MPFPKYHSNVGLFIRSIISLTALGIIFWFMLSPTMFIGRYMILIPALSWGVVGSRIIELNELINKLHKWSNNENNVTNTV